MNLGITRGLSKSQEWLERALKVIPSATQTFSKGYEQFVQGASPVFLERGKGSHVWDVDGNEYLDFINALLPVILGYAHPEVDEAVRRQLARGVSFSLPHPLEVELAERLVDLIPCAEMVRYGKNGSDATSAAVRAARAYTGRDLVACCGYHGWQDWYVGSTVRNAGVPAEVAKLTHRFEYNRLDSLAAIFAEHPGRVACAIMEPVSFTPPQEGYLEGVREMTRREGAVLVFDEIITGFRLAPGGAQEFFGVTPDLACFGKAMSNGYPLSAVVGRRDIMKLFDEVFFSFTFGGETLSLAAALAVIEVLVDEQGLRSLWDTGQMLTDRVQDLISAKGLEKTVTLTGYPVWSRLGFRDEAGAESRVLASLFMQETIARGVLMHGTHNLSLSHTAADLDYTLAVYDEVFDLLAGGGAESRLKGPVVQPVFRVRD